MKKYIAPDFVLRSIDCGEAVTLSSEWHTVLYDGEVYAAFREAEPKNG